MKTFASTALLLFLLNVTGFSQPNVAMSISKTIHDFGNILEKNGAVTHVFTFANTGSDTLELQRVKSSHPNLLIESYSAKVPGKGNGEIKVKFTPKDESGRVERFLSIRTNEPAMPVRQASIVATVAPREKTTADYYPVKSGHLWFDVKHLAFDQFKNTESRTDTFKIYNTWNKPMTLAMKQPPAHTSWKIVPDVLKPEKEGLIIVTYDAPKSGIWGLNFEVFNIATNDSIEPEKMITLGVNISEDFSKLTEEQKSNPPRIEFTAVEHHFGSCTAGSVMEHAYHFKNTGKSDLIIRRVKPGCGCTVAELKKTTLKPGEEEDIIIKFNTTGYSGRAGKSVMVTSNDPDHPMTVLSFSADVQPKP